MARDARWKRKQHSTDQLLCTSHAQLLRDADGLDPLDDNGGRLT